jgi:hypothetical protein
LTGSVGEGRRQGIGGLRRCARRFSAPEAVVVARTGCASRLSSVRAFMTREVEPVINDYWTRAEFPFLRVSPAKDGTTGT